MSGPLDRTRDLFDRLSQFLGKSSACHKQVPNSKGRDGSLPALTFPTFSLNCCQLMRVFKAKIAMLLLVPPLVVPLLPELQLVGLLQLLLSLPELGQDEGDDLPRLLDLLLIHLDLELLLVGNGDHPVMMFNIRIAQT